MIFYKSTIKSIPINQIDHSDGYFKVSRNYIDERLSKSVNDSGLLELPVLKKNDGKFTIIFGHNRVKILMNAGVKHFDSIVIDEISPEQFQQAVLLKNYRRELGPTGKIKFLMILKEYFFIDDDVVKSQVLKNLDFPGDFVADESLLKKIISLPEEMKAYFDHKDIGIKIILDVVNMSDAGMKIICEWIKKVPIKVNYFKNIIDYMLDICRRDGSLEELKDLNIDHFNNNKELEEFIYDSVFSLRYPEYFSLKKNADKIISRLVNKDIKINFPCYFEKDYLDLILRIKKGESLKGAEERIDKLINDEQFQKLLLML